MVGGTAAAYAAHLARVLDMINACGGGGGGGAPAQRRVYLPAPGVTPRRDEYVRQFADRRTTARARHWRDLGQHVAHAAGWRFVDHWALTRAHVWEVMDLGASLPPACARGADTGRGRQTWRTFLGRMRWTRSLMRSSGRAASARRSLRPHGRYIGTLWPAIIT
jgi:hypothetical protein